MEYQPVQYSGIVPQLQVPDFVRPFEESQQRLRQQEQQEMADLDRDSKTELQNLQNSFVDTTDQMEQLASLSKTLAEQVDKTRIQERQNKYDDTFFKFYNAGAKEQVAAAQAQREQEAQLTKEGEKTASVVKKVTSKQPEVAGILQQAQSLSGVQRLAALNALSSSRLEQFPDFLTQFVAARKPRNPQEYKAAEAEALSSWAAQTGMNTANEGYLALHVTPKLKSYAAANQEVWTRGYNKQQGSDARMRARVAFINGGSSQAYFDTVTSTISSDGVSLASYDQAWQGLSEMVKDGSLTQARLTKFGDEKINGKPVKEHPRYAVLVADARSFKLKKDKEDRQIQTLDSINGFNAAGDDRVSLEREAARQRDAGIPEDIVQSNLTKARSGSIETTLTRQQVDEGKRWLTNNPGQKLPYTMHSDWTFEAKQQLAGQLQTDPTTETPESRVRGSEEFKALDKDLPALISQVDPTVPIQNDALGVKGASNQEAFELQTKNWIANRAAQLMLSAKDPLNISDAIEQAKQEWVTGQKALVTSKGLEAFYKDGRFVAGMGTHGIHHGRAQSAAGIAYNINRATLNNLEPSLFPEDYEYRDNGVYSERVNLLARKFGLLPEQIVTRARSLKGMDVPKLGGAAALTSNLKPADRARLNSVTDPSTQSLLRAQINSGQLLEGTPQQRTVALGRHLLTLGYGGIWQNEYFDYDKGYVPAGGQRVMKRSYPSAHNDPDGGRALDFGLAANGAAKLDQLAYYLNKNRERFGIARVLWKTEGHWDHLHVELK